MVLHIIGAILGSIAAASILITIYVREVDLSEREEGEEVRFELRRSIVVELDERLINRIRRIATQEDIAFDSALENLLKKTLL